MEKERKKRPSGGRGRRRKKEKSMASRLKKREPANRERRERVFHSHFKPTALLLLCFSRRLPSWTGAERGLD
jgi:hypothetical protein